MARRELYTIGSLGRIHAPTRGRTIGRMVKHPLWTMSGLGDAGSIAADQQAAIEALTTYFQSNAPTTGKVAAVGLMQQAWNEGPLSGSGITVDSEYGGNSQAAFQQMLDHYGEGVKAPANAFGDVVPSVPKATPGTLPTPSLTTPAAPLVDSGDSTGWIAPVAIGAAVVAGLVWFFKKKKGGTRRRATGHFLTVRSNPMRRCA